MSEPARDGLRILVVDDEPDQLALLRTYLQRAGCTVTTAATGELAVAAADQPVDLAIIDLLLPGIGGADVIAVLRARQPSCRIAVTSVLDSRDYPPADAVLPKPFTREEVVALLPTTGIHVDS